ncbi:1,2-diacylglycerol 3-alpha-glucosyltransferase [Candidatus Phytoplasma luffae]|uniref:1,2-diacylglycerol 3-alpha-glucosyltransferase n=1 Tax=Loofah witches'-broom phytoplasma TaxID=35773 RepID=A0A975FIP4_LOWBP|nr:glycosyltransferase [Candidatus Phytoplasma luffae]QTX03198.1 1,2-diacylglycerol 3-alpha-glucosyltransferase [Candidatus Phytoplasma luffae]
MKIGLFIDAYAPSIGGVQTSNITLKESLEALGHEVYIITLHAVPRQKETDPYVLRLNGGIPLYIKGLKGYRLLIRYKKFLPKIESLNLDVIHVHTEFGVGHLGLYASKKLKLPLIYTMHTMYHCFIQKNNFVYLKLFKKMITKFIDKLLKKLINEANIIIAPTQKTLLFFKDYYKIEKNYQIVPSGIKLKKFYSTSYKKEEIDILKEKLGLKDFFICLYIGRVSEEKEINIIIDYFSDFYKKNKKSKLLIIGDGPNKIKLQKQVKKLKLTENIIFLNFVPNNEIGLYYQLGDVFVGASLFETQGLTYIEALSASLPVLARYDTALDQVIQHNQNGFFFRNKEEFVQNLNILYNDKKKYYEMSNNAEKSVHNYKQEIFAQKIIDIYQKAIEENNNK